RRRLARVRPRSCWLRDAAVPAELPPVNTARSMPPEKCLPVEEITITRPRVIVDVLHDRRKLGPELRHHGVQLVGALELDMRDAAGDLDVEAAIGHGVSFRWKSRVGPARRRRR